LGRDASAEVSVELSSSAAKLGSQQNDSSGAATESKQTTARVLAQQRVKAAENSAEMSPSSAAKSTIEQKIQPSAAADSKDKQKGPAPGSMGFTPKQQKVAAALMAVLKRAGNEGIESVLAAKNVLSGNNKATESFLALVPDKGEFPTLSAIEQSAPSAVLQSLALLAGQCALASCQPLEVFTRSMQCNTQVKAVQRFHGTWDPNFKFFQCEEPVRKQRVTVSLWSLADESAELVHGSDWRRSCQSKARATDAGCH